MAVAGDGRDDRPAASTARVRSRRELNTDVVAAIVLSVVTILTAWSAFEASKWGGVMSIRFSEAGAARTQSAQASARANTKQAVDVGLFTNYAAAVSAGDDRLVEFLEERFRDEFRPAFEAWRALDPLDNPDAPATPFEMDEYRIAESAESQELQETADLRAQQARDANQRGDNYTLLTVLFASVLFFAGISTKFEGRRIQQALVALAVVMMLVGIGLLLTFPVEI
jgi:hypothetical protein